MDASESASSWRSASWVHGSTGKSFTEPTRFASNLLLLLEHSRLVIHEKNALHSPYLAGSSTASRS
jgi:hypothetical protein